MLQKSSLQRRKNMKYLTQFSFTFCCKCGKIKIERILMHIHEAVELYFEYRGEYTYIYIHHVYECVNCVEVYFDP